MHLNQNSFREIFARNLEEDETSFKLVYNLLEKIDYFRRNSN